ncbi:hypothetical protein ACLMAL_27385 [Nocardia sp. CWNU-33]|uniref:hypothetical protein n=1 Tax=Nocardia sp. CWNU-33 TaxID=3392117 RepID=UPI00398E741F
MTQTRRWRTSMLGACVVALTATGCIGAVDRGDFENLVHERGGGLVTALPAAAIEALRERLGVADFQTSVILLTAPNSSQLRIVVPDQPPQLTRFLSEKNNLAGPQAWAHLRIRVPQQSEQLDDYTFGQGSLSKPTPVQVSASDDLDGEAFAVSEVTGLSRIEDVVDTALARSGLEQGYVSTILANRFGRDILITVNVTSPRAAAVAQFDRAGAFIRVQRA